MKYRIILLLTTISLFMSCSESILGDIDIDDFSLIHPRIIVNRSHGDYNKSDITVWLHDKKGDSFHLKTGELSCNGVKMTPNNLLGTYWYDIDNMSVEADSTYSFVITLSNDEKCTTTVTTPQKAFEDLNIPQSISLAEGLSVTWEKVDGEKINYHHTVKYSLNNITNTYIVASKNNISDIGKYTSEAILINNYNTLLSSYFSITRSSNNYNYSSKLGGDGSVECEFSFETNDITVTK